MYVRIVYKIQARRTAQRVSLHSCASLQVLLDLGRVFAVEALCLLVELGVPLVDVVDVGVVVVSPASAVLGPLLDPAKNAKRESRQERSLLESTAVSLAAFSNK